MADTIFLNADYVVVEYMDFIKSPYFVLLSVLSKNERLREILKIEEIEHLNADALLEWYIYRKNQNFLIDLNRFPDKISDSQLDELLVSQLNSSPHFYELANLLPVGNSIKYMKSQKIAKDIIIFSPFKSKQMKDNLEKELGIPLTFMYDFGEILDLCKSNSTYFLSNISHIEEMERKNYLNFSSITLPMEFRYNRKNLTEWKLNLNKIVEKHPVKISYTFAYGNGGK